MYATFAGMYTIPQWAIPIVASSPEQHSKTSPMIGYAPSAV